MKLSGIYSDDGCTGTDFDRPEFQRMMSDIRKGQVNCVIVKDLSRLGRDYIETGRLIRKTFPSLHVRFIAVTDRFDSETADRYEKDLVLPLKSFINDAYCRDISCKVRSQQKIKREQGRFAGAFPAYGYRRSAEDRYRLCPDPPAAETVKLIFRWKTEGMSALAIAKQLNQSGVLSPLEYKRANGDRFYSGFSAGSTAAWSSAAVKRILTNELYTGVMLQGKTERISYKVKKTVAKPKEEWARVEGTHKPIISRDEFALVQRLLLSDTRADARTGRCSLFAGFLFCGDCGAPMTRRVCRYKTGEAYFCICSGGNKGTGCSSHRIAQKELENIVLAVLQIYTADFRRKDSVKVQPFGNGERKKRFCGKDMDDAEQRLCKLQREYRRFLEGLCEDRKAGIISAEEGREFCRKYRQRYEKRKRFLKTLREEDRLTSPAQEDDAAGREAGEEYRYFTGLERDMLLCFINRIEVYERKKVYIEFRAGRKF